jgi:large repetitive protein
MQKIYTTLTFCLIVSYELAATKLAPAIVITNLSSTNFCPGQNGTISFTSTITTATTYAVQISSFDGTFGSNPTVVGTGSSSPLSFVLPTYTPSSNSLFKLRIVNTQSPFQQSDGSEVIYFKQFTASIQDIIGINTSYTYACAGSYVKLISKLSLPDNGDVVYEWKKDGNIISGADTAKFVTNLTGQYTVKATKAGCGNVTSSTYSVYNTTQTPGITSNNPFIYQCAGTSFPLTASYAPENMTFEWKKDNVILPNETKYFLNISSTGSYSLKTSDPNCTTSYSDSRDYIFGNIIPSNITTNSGDFVDTLVRCPNFFNYLQFGQSASNLYQFQWKKDGVNIAGETRNIYYASVAGVYSVQVKQGNCVTTSKPFVMRTDILPSSVIKIKGGTNICTGTEPSQLYIDGLACPNSVSYQWQKDGIDIPTQTNTTYSPSQTGGYRLKITNGSIITYSNVISIIAGNTPNYQIISNYDTLTCKPFGFYQLNGNFLSSSTYQWFKDGVVFNANGSNSQYLGTSVEGKYKLRVTIGSCVGFSQEINLVKRSLPKPIISSQNRNIICPNTFTLLRTAPPNFVVTQWKKNGVNISGSQHNLIATESGNYSVVYSVSDCTAESDPIKINVGDKQQTIKTADWNNATTWSCGTIPTITEDVLINRNHVISLPNGYTGFLKNLEINGRIINSTNAQLKFLQN